MSEERLRHAFRLRLLALVLALALTWYAMNPAPAPVCRGKRDEGQPDEKRQPVKLPVVIGYYSVVTEAVVLESDINSAGEKTDDLEWPEVIEVS